MKVAQIEHALRTLAINKRYRFNAHQVAYLSGNSDVNEVYKYLVTREPYILQRSYEVLCPGRMDSAMEPFSSMDQVPKNRWVECRVCGEEFLPDPNLVHIVFYFNPEYLKDLHMEIEEEKKSRHPLMLAH